MRQREEEPRARLWRRAAQQRGYFTAAQALEDGYSYQSQHFHVQRGNWTRVDRGVYRFREFADLPADENDHLVRWTLWSRGRGVVSHSTALGVHDLGIANPAEIHLTVPPGFRQRDPAVVVHHADLSPDGIEEREGFRVTTPVRAIAESAADGLDQDAIDSAVADLLDRGAATRGQLLRAAQHLGARAELAVTRAFQAERA
ncbi:type IV toxin-antitoxin system AbiEi family antitoxin domain-containing protein [Spirillospora albida]|uniref:type IV toxin-antitoxin system AbiEi family antitoxin domain-containing protein n=1 Tax=Spirillospora albida TaxID=58123 RepID=UPI0004C1D90D|nr:type IV toxin-antitoxin system AbiEi family antitoxin domain-containing protein [Spirillospora albida]